jgi:hypothetical protein
MRSIWDQYWPGEAADVDDDSFDEEREPLACDPEGVIRCPMCGLTRAARWFDETLVEQHALERCIRVSLGGRRGFHLHRGYELSVDDVEALQACAIRVLRRLQEYAQEIGAGVLAPAADPERDTP